MAVARALIRPQLVRRHVASALPAHIKIILPKSAAKTAQQVLLHRRVDLRPVRRANQGLILILEVLPAHRVLREVFNLHLPALAAPLVLQDFTRVPPVPQLASPARREPSALLLVSPFVLAVLPVNIHLLIAVAVRHVLLEHFLPPVQVLANPVALGHFPRVSERRSVQTAWVELIWLTAAPALACLVQRELFPPITPPAVPLVLQE